jgi:flagellar biosynthetic protein FliR
VSFLGPTTILATFLIFCRIGACLMLMPGISSPRVAVQVRLFIAIAVTLALTPLLLQSVEPAIADASPFTLFHLIVSETLTGGLIGLLGRCFFIALETMGTAIADSIGLSNALGVPIEGNDSVPELVTIITMAATVLLFITDQHWEILRGLVASYNAWPVAQGFGPRLGLTQLTDTVTIAFVATLRISSPFLIYSLIIHFAIGLANKLTPQISIFFISMPFTLMGGIVLLYFVSKQYLDLFMRAFSSWLVAG